ncbi:MAG: hypothetical protein VB138_12660 [Burkholderia sp.]
MSPNRNDLLDQLREARSLGRETEQRLRHVLAQAPDPQRPGMETLLAQTIEHQKLLGQSVMRIEDTGTPSRSDMPDAAAGQASPEAADGPRSPALLDLRDAILREVDLYSELIETAEATGFYETKCVCEGILSRKSSTVEWLGTAARPNQPE